MEELRLTNVFDTSALEVQWIEQCPRFQTLCSGRALTEKAILPGELSLGTSGLNCGPISRISVLTALWNPRPTARSLGPWMPWSSSDSKCVCVSGFWFIAPNSSTLQPSRWQLNAGALFLMRGKLENERDRGKVAQQLMVSAGR